MQRQAASVVLCTSQICFSCVSLQNRGWGSRVSSVFVTWCQTAPSSGTASGPTHLFEGEAKEHLCVPVSNSMFVGQRAVFALVKLKACVQHLETLSVPAASQRFVSDSNAALALLRVQGCARVRARRVRCRGHLARGSAERERLEIGRAHV